MHHKEHHGFLYGLLAALLLACSAVFVKWGAKVPNATIVGIRFIISLLCMLPYILSGRVHIHWNSIPKHFLRAVAGLVAISCYFYSVKNLPLVNAVTLANTGPIFMPIVLFIWLKLVLPKGRIWPLVIGFIGVLVILRPGPDFGVWATLIGLTGGLFAAIAQVGVRQLSKTESTETILAYYFIISTALTIPLMILTWEPISSPFLWLDLALISLFSVAFQYFFTKSLTHAPASKVSVMSYLGVVFSGLLGWWIFAEEPSLWVLAGSVLIIVGGIVALLSKEQPRKWSR